MTDADLCNHFLTAKLCQLEAGELSPQMFNEYRATTDRLVNDLAADDFGGPLAEMAKQFGPVR